MTQLINYVPKFLTDTSVRFYDACKAKFDAFTDEERSEAAAKEKAAYYAPKVIAAARRWRPCKGKFLATLKRLPASCWIAAAEGAVVGLFLGGVGRALWSAFSWGTIQFWMDRLFGSSSLGVGGATAATSLFLTKPLFGGSWYQPVLEGAFATGLDYTTRKVLYPRLRGTCAGVKEACVKETPPNDPTRTYAEAHELTESLLHARKPNPASLPKPKEEDLLKELLEQKETFVSKLADFLTETIAEQSRLARVFSRLIHSLLKKGCDDLLQRTIKHLGDPQFASSVLPTAIECITNYAKALDRAYMQALIRAEEKKWAKDAHVDGWDLLRSLTDSPDYAHVLRNLLKGCTRVPLLASIVSRLIPVNMLITMVFSHLQKSDAFKKSINEALIDKLGCVAEHLPTSIEATSSPQNPSGGASIGHATIDSDEVKQCIKTLLGVIDCASCKTVQELRELRAPIHGQKHLQNNALDNVILPPVCDAIANMLPKLLQEQLTKENAYSSLTQILKKGSESLEAMQAEIGFVTISKGETKNVEAKEAIREFLRSALRPAVDFVLEKQPALVQVIESTVLPGYAIRALASGAKSFGFDIPQLQTLAATVSSTMASNAQREVTLNQAMQSQDPVSALQKLQEATEKILPVAKAREEILRELENLIAQCQKDAENGDSAQMVQRIHDYAAMGSVQLAKIKAMHYPPEHENDLLTLHDVIAENVRALAQGVEALHVVRTSTAGNAFSREEWQRDRAHWREKNKTVARALQMSHVEKWLDMLNRDETQWEKELPTLLELQERLSAHETLREHSPFGELLRDPCVTAYKNAIASSSPQEMTRAKQRLRQFIQLSLRECTKGKQRAAARAHKGAKRALSAQLEAFSARMKQPIETKNDFAPFTALKQGVTDLGVDQIVDRCVGIFSLITQPASFKCGVDHFVVRPINKTLKV